MEQSKELVRRLHRVENDTVSIYDLISGIQETLNDHAHQFVEIRQTLDDHGRQLIEARQTLDDHGRMLHEILRRLPEAS